MKIELAVITEGIIARIANTEFAFLLTKANPAQIEQYLQTLIRIINQEISKIGCDANSQFSIGVSQRIENMKPSDLLSQADNALQQAFREIKVCHWLDAEQTQKYSREQWRTKLLDTINNNHFVFQWQPVFNLKKKTPIQREIYCRLMIDDQLINAVEFMPFIELLSLGNQLDRCLLVSIEQQNILELTKQVVAVNLTHESIQDANFPLWLAEFLKRSGYGERLCFELPESALLSSFEQCCSLSKTIKAARSKVGIDQCGRQLGSLEYLQELQPDYIKLDQSFAYYEKSNRSKEICRALINFAKGLGIEVIITGIEDEEQLEQFKPLKADGYQGYISAPTDLKSML